MVDWSTPPLPRAAAPQLSRLNLTFLGEIDPERSSWTFASVGRMSFTIAKAEHNQTMWGRLLRTKTKPKNMVRPPTQCLSHTSAPSGSHTLLAE
jgi:hypothetical protein